MANLFLKSYFAKKFWIGVLILGVFLLFVSGIFFKKTSNPQYQTYKVKKADIIQEVYVTGQIKTPEIYNLAFEKSGKIIKINVKVGDTVSKGKILAELDSSELLAQLQQEQANLEVQEIKLKEIKKGARPEEIALAQVKVQNADIALKQAEQNLHDELQKTFDNSDDVIRSKLDSLFLNPNGANPQLIFPVNDSSLKYSVEEKRKNIALSFDLWGKNIFDFDISKKNLITIREFLDDIALLVSSLVPSTSLSQNTIETYKTNISAGRNIINNAIISLNNAKEKLQSAKSSLEIAQKELELKKAGATEEQIATQEALIKQVRAKISSIQAQIDKNSLRSPVAGIVAKINVQVGEIARANENIISILPNAPLQIEANIPEIDIGKIALGNLVKITIDAYPGEIFEGFVSYIEPSETIVEGVVNYKTIVSFKNLAQKIKSGLSANLSIETSRKNEVLAIPNYAYIERQNNFYAKKLTDGSIQEVKIDLGIKGQNGLVEVLSGLNEGDEIINVGLINE